MMRKTRGFSTRIYLIMIAARFSSFAQLAPRKTRTGHVEADLMAGSRNSGHIAVMICRYRRRCWLKYALLKTKSMVSRAIIFKLRGYKCVQITYDNGTEFFAHLDVNEALRCTSGKCQPYAPWQKGSVERLIKEICQRFLKKGTSASLTDECVQEIEDAMNDTVYSQVLNGRRPNY